MGTNPRKRPLPSPNLSSPGAAAAGGDVAADEEVAADAAEGAEDEAGAKILAKF